MTRWRRVWAAAALASSAIGTVWLTQPAGADTAPVTGGSWFWREQVSSVSTPVSPVAPPAPLPTPDVPDGDFAVAVKGTDPTGQDVGHDKETFLHIDTSSIPEGSTVSSFKLTITEDTTARGNLNATAAKIAAYPVTGYFTDGGAAAPWEQRPEFDPNTIAANGQRTAPASGAATWTFDLTALVGKWVGGSLANNGIALVGTGIDTTTQPWEVVWAGKPAPTTQGQFTPPAASVETTDTTPDTTSDTTPGSFPVEPVTITPDLSAPIITPAPLPAPVAAPPVRVAPRRIAAHHTPGITLGFIAAALVLAATMVAGMVSLGELGEPQPPRRGSVLRALERGVGQPVGSS